jgi:polar amino acid transport system substrate-binding protein
MKKILYIISALLIIGILSSCQKDDTLRVGMDLRWPPFETIEGDGAATGISVDLAYALGESLNRDVEIVDLEFGSLITSLQTGDIDVIIGSMSITDERALSINFSDPYFHFPLVTVLHVDADINSVEELMSREGVRFVGPKTFVSLTIPLAQANNPIILETNDANAAILELISGNADAFLISASSAAGYHASYPNLTEIIWDPVDLSPIGMGVAFGNDELLSDINTFISELETSGVYDSLRNTYDSVIAAALPGKGLDFYIYPNE